MKAFALVLVTLGVAIHDASGDAFIDRLVAAYNQIYALQCEVRTEVQDARSESKGLSRVYLEKPDKLHVENATPISRRIISNGKELYYYVTGDKKGFSKTIPDLNQAMKIELRKIPGTPLEHLYRLEGLTGTDLSATSECTSRRSYTTEKHVLVLCLDGSGRLVRIEFFEDARMSKRLAAIEFGGLFEPVNGAWVARTETIRSWLGEKEQVTTKRFRYVTVNKPIPAELFDEGRYFENVTFVASFAEVNR